VRLSHTRVVAPDDGVISVRMATVGAVVQPGTELFRLIRKNRLEWRGEVAAPELARIKPGMAVAVTPAGGAAVTGTVRVVAPTVDAASRNGMVYVDLPNPGSGKAGMFARGEFNIGEQSALTLPQSAVLLRDGFSYVFRLGEGNKVQRIKVGVGRRNGDRVEIVSGLEATARVVSQGAGFLADGDVVRVATAPATPAPAAAVAAKP
jgi:HlyD family secretion protein